MKASLDIVTALSSASPLLAVSVAPAKAFVDKTPDLCGGTVAAPGDCSKTICTKWVSGLKSGIGIANSRRSLISSFELDTHFDGKFGEVLNTVLAGSNIDEEHDLDVGHARNLAGSYTNTYSSSGYDAVGVGCSDNKDGMFYD